MVYVKRVELSRFKSFGGTKSIPFLPGFTVISGPNGSGKSNILDALLFCLGLASSKGMRAERLPDLINHNHSNNGRTAEASVSVTFDLSDLTELDLSPDSNSSSESENNPDAQTQLERQPSSEFRVTRRLRVTKGGNYASTFYVNDQPCTSSELHSQLNRLRIYPEGYNVVLQGDVTRIITMNSRERREIIDELAGVAEFDRKIEQTKKTLDAVREREERCEIIQQELLKNSDRLQNDRQKAEKYQKLKAKIHEKQQWEVVLNWRTQQQEQQNLQKAVASMEEETRQLQQRLTTLAGEIEQADQEFTQLNHQVKELGEEEQISVASKLATQKAKGQQLQQRQQELSNLTQHLAISCTQTETEIEVGQQNLALLNQEQLKLERQTLPGLLTQTDEARATLAATKQKARAIASKSQEWLEKQTNLAQEITQLQQTLNPKLTQKALLSQRYQQLQQTIETQNQQLATQEMEITSKQQDTANLTREVQNAEGQVQTLARQIANLDADISLSQETTNRLLKEQREKQRQLDKLEATKQAQQEAQGTYATKIILHSDLPGVCGLVAQLGQVEPRYQLALEIAAGARLSYIVVEDESVASAGIQLLKQKKVGRATFLPLNKIQSPRFTETVVLRYAAGFVESAVNLINCESRYHAIFAYVFGKTIVFENLDSARAYLGKHRIVTLDGEILELSGAMTGGSMPSRPSLHFGTLNYSDSEELELLRHRLKDIEDIISQVNHKLAQKAEIVKELTENLHQGRQKRQKEQLRLEQLQQELGRLERQKEQLTASSASNYQQIVTAKKELKILEQEIPILEVNLAEKQHELADLKASHQTLEWQEIQAEIAERESSLELQQAALRKEESKLQELVNQCLLNKEKITQAKQKLAGYQQQQQEIANQQQNLVIELSQVNQNIATNEELFQQVAARLERVKQQRDEAETQLRNLQNQEQKTSWQLQKLADKKQEKQELLLNLTTEIEQMLPELPNPLPEIPLLVNNPALDRESKAITSANLKEQLEQLQKEIRNGLKRLEAMEPVNMLALEEYERNQERLKELSEKLATLKAERTELLLRVENFTTLRFRAFKEAFDAVNENFQSIFASLSDGDGYLQLDAPESPFDGGLNLIAHPKGKPVKRLSSMSGGEKSLTALSFIFALQRYRPSPFYAFDEVDMFLDGANVEKLAKMIRKQAQQAQFMVVSLRRPMIESAERTIGVTQARGAYTQVLGIKL